MVRSWFGLVWFGLFWFGLVWFGLEEVMGKEEVLCQNSQSLSMQGMQCMELLGQLKIIIVSLMISLLVTALTDVDICMFLQSDQYDWFPMFLRSDNMIG